MPQKSTKIAFSLLCITILGTLIVNPGIGRGGHAFAQQPFFKYDIIIDIGHGGIDGGTTRGAILEKKLNLEIGTKLYEILENNGYKVGITRLHDYALSDDSPFSTIRSRHKRDLRQRQLIAEGLQPRLFLSIHVNSSAHRYVKGPMILFQKKAESYLLAELLQEKLNQVSSTHNKNKLSYHYYLLNKISQPALIAEVGYISHPSERIQLQDPSYQHKIANQMAHSINEYFLIYP